MTSHFVNWVLPLRYRLYTSPPRGVLNSTRAALTPAPYFRHRGNRRILIIPFNHPPLLSNYHSDNRSTFSPRMTKIRSIDILLRSCLRRSSIFTYIANFSPTRRRRETSFAIISSKVSSLLHTQLARKREMRPCEISAAPRNYPDFRELCKLRYYEIQIESQKLDRMSLLRIWCRQYLPPGREST